MISSPSDLVGFVERFRDHRVLVIGDMVADAYIVGRPARISREAPVLILQHSEEFVCPGQAANVAYNLAALGARVCVGGVIGDDTWGKRLQMCLAELAIDVSGLIVDPLRATATKTRVIARGQQEIQQQIVRIDRVNWSSLDHGTEEQLTAWVLRMLGSIDAVIVSDYEYGVIGRGVLESALPEAERRGILTAVDSHGDLFRFKGVTVATPNQPEAEATLGRELETTEQVETGGEEIRAGMDAGGVLITRGNQGMSLIQRDEPPVHLEPTNVREVFDPTGAGDTVCAVLTLALLGGASMLQAAELSNIAAGEVVKKLGAATVSAEELRAAL